MNDLLNPNLSISDDELLTLRPTYLKEYIGQSKAKDMLNIYIKAALMRDESLDHVLLYGPPGLGKTTLAYIIANELHVNIKVISGPSIEKTGDLVSVLTSLEEGDVLFIDEIHRLPKFIEEVLYSAMEDYVLDIVIGKDNTKKSIRIDLPPFTLVGATTRFGDLSSPLRARFGVVLRLDYYSDNELFTIAKRTSEVYQSSINDNAARELAKRSRGTPRIVNRLFRRVRDFADILNNRVIDEHITNVALNKLDIDQNGLEHTDYEYLECLIGLYNGGPAGLDSISATIGEERTTVEDVYEPFLLKEGYIKRTSRGRVATPKAYNLVSKPNMKGLL